MLLCLMISGTHLYFKTSYLTVQEVLNRLQTAKIDITTNETTCNVIGNQFISRDKCKTCVNHVWSNDKIVYCLKDYKPKESKKSTN